MPDDRRDRPTFDAAALLDRTSEGVLTADRAWQCTYANQCAESVLGVTAEELLGADLRDWGLAPEWASDGDWVRRAAATGEPRRFERSPSALDGRIEARIEGRVYVETDASTDSGVAGFSVYVRRADGRGRRDDGREQDGRRERGKRGERGERAFEPQQYRTVVETVGDGMYAVDADGRLTMVNEAFASMTGHAVSDLVGEHVSRLTSDAVVEAAAEGYEAMVAGERNAVRIDGHIEAADGTTIPTETKFRLLTDERGEPTGSVGVVRDSSDRKRYERRLTALHDVSRELLSAETRADASEQVVAAATDILDGHGFCIYLFDEDENVLVRAASDAMLEEGAPPARIGPTEGSDLWTVFLDSRSETFETVRFGEGASASASVAVSPPEVNRVVVVPLGSHGVVVAGTTAESFDDEIEELVDLLAATAEAAFDRVHRESQLRRRETELERQNERLERLNRINETIRKIDKALVASETRVDIEHAVCESLVDIEPHAFVWVGDPDTTSERLVPREWAGRERGYLDTVTLALDADEPAVEAARTERVTVVENAAAALKSTPWRKDALRRDYRSVIALPLTYNGISYGVLAVYAAQRSAFDEMARTVLAELSETIAYAIDAVEYKNAQLADREIELEFEVTDANALLYRLARRTDSALRIESVIRQEDGRTVEFVAVTDGSVERVLERAREFVSVADARLLRADEEAALVRLELHDRPPSVRLAGHGFRLEAFTATPESARLTVGVAPTAEVRTVTDLVAESYPDSRLVSRRERAESAFGWGMRDRYVESLTDRQREVAQVAYHSGYFEWPRACTGGDLADAFGVSPPTLHRHLRVAERKLFEAIFDDR